MELNIQGNEAIIKGDKNSLAAKLLQAKGSIKFGGHELKIVKTFTKPKNKNSKK